MIAKACTSWEVFHIYDTHTQIISLYKINSVYQKHLKQIGLEDKLYSEAKARNFTETAEIRTLCCLCEYCFLPTSWKHGDSLMTE